MTSIPGAGRDFRYLDDMVNELEERFGAFDLVEKRVRVTCPSCGATGTVVACKDVVLSTRDNMYDFPVPAGTICEHAFIVQIDANLKAR